MQLYFDQTGKMPANNWSCAGILVPVAGSCGAYDLEASQPVYDMSMQELVNAGFLSSIPRSPGGAGYAWYNYGGGNSTGGIIQTTLETVPNTTTGISPSCGPFSVNNWCMHTVGDKQYCICNLH